MTLDELMTHVYDLVYKHADLEQVAVLVIRNCLVFHSQLLLRFAALSLGLLALQQLLHGVHNYLIKILLNLLLSANLQFELILDELSSHAVHPNVEG